MKETTGRSGIKSEDLGNHGSGRERRETELSHRVIVRNSWQGRAEKKNLTGNLWAEDGGKFRYLTYPPPRRTRNDIQGTLAGRAADDKITAPCRYLNF